MLFKELEELLANNIIKVGDEVWVTDYRFKKQTMIEEPIRHVEPTKVVITSNDDLPKNKRVYYTDYHFRPLGKTGVPLARVIAPYDNTGWRSYTGVSLNIFRTEDEARAKYAELCDEATQLVNNSRLEAMKHFDDVITKISNNKTKNK